MAKFDFAFGELNDVRLPVISKRTDPDRDSMWSQISAAIDDFFAPDALAKGGPYKAVVLRVEPINAENAKPLGFLDFIYDQKKF